MNVNLNTGVAARRNEAYDGFIHRTHAGSLTLNGYVQTGEIEHNLLFGIDAKELFTAMYNALIGKDQGPRLASFMKIIGKEKLSKILSVY